MLPAEPRLRGITEQHGRRPVLTGRGPEAASVIQELALRLVVFGEAGGRLRVDQNIFMAVKRPCSLLHYENPWFRMFKISREPKAHVSLSLFSQASLRKRPLRN